MDALQTPPAPPCGPFSDEETEVHRCKSVSRLSDRWVSWVSGKPLLPLEAPYPRWCSGKEPACHAGDAGDTGSIPGSGRSPGEGNSQLLQYSCLENPMDRGAWWATVHRVASSRTERLSTHPEWTRMAAVLVSPS